MGKGRQKLGPPRKGIRRRDKRRLKKVPLQKYSHQMWAKDVPTPSQQYLLLGIRSDPNTQTKSHVLKKKMIEKNVKASVLQKYSTRHLFDFLPSVKTVITRKQIKRQTKKDVFRRLIRLQKKHGSDFERMAVDVRVNILQDSTSQLKKKMKWMNKVEYDRRLLGCYFFGHDIESDGQIDWDRFKNDKVFNWMGLDENELKEDIRRFIRNDLKKEHLELLDKNKSRNDK